MESLAGKRLVIFGCGYVGAAIARWGMASGMSVRALTRNAATALLLREVEIETIVADLASDSWHRELTDGADIAVDCVGSGGGGAEGYRHSYLRGIESIAAWATAHGPVATLVYTSSTSVYPEGGGALVSEASPADAHTDRARVLVETENRVRAAAGAWRRWFILRLAGIYGPGRHQLLDQVRKGEASGSAEHHLNLVHRDDVVSAVAACCTAPLSIGDEIFNVSDDGRARRSEVVGWLAGQLRLPAPSFSGLPAGERRPVTPDRIIVNERIKTVLGWRPRYPTFREGYANLLSR